MILKITIFGLTISSSWGNGHATPYRAILRALNRLGHQITFYEKDVEYYYWRRDLANCDYCNLVLYPNWETVRSEAIRQGSESDVVIVGSYCPEGSLICDEVLSLARPVRIFYDLDTPITLTKLDSGDVDYLRRDQMPGFDLYLSFTGGPILEELESHWGVRRARALYGCVDPEVHARVDVVEKYRCDLSYMGTYANDRQPKLEELFLKPAQTMAEASFTLAGSLYPKSWTWPENVRRYDHVPPGQHPALYSSSRATLNITRDGMARGGYCPSGRFFEAAACGTPIVSDWFEGLEYFFEPGEQIRIARSADDVLGVLRTPDSELSKMARCARERVLSEHTGEVRARELLRFIEEATGRTDYDAARASDKAEIELR